MKKLTDVILIAGFLTVDWLIFHDFFKVGETYTFTEYLTGLLSILVIIVSIRSLLKK